MRSPSASGVRPKPLVVTLVVLLVLGVVAGGAAIHRFSGTKPGAKPGTSRGARNARPVPVGVVEAKRQSTPVYVDAIGNIEPYSTVAVRSRVDGQITEVNFKEGQEVKRGEVLFRIDSRPYEAALRQAEANAMRDAAARDHARAQAKRYEGLLAKHFVSSDAYAQMQTNAATAEATAKASEAALESARLNLGYCVIRAPIDGFVGRVLLQAGNLVKANDASPLVVINKVRPIYATFAVPEQTLPAIREHSAHTPLEVSVLAPNAGTLLARGQLVFIDNTVDASTGTIKLRARFANRNIALWPGQFVHLRVKLYEDANTIVVPSSAVSTGPSGQFVYVVTPKKVARMRDVTVSRTEGELAIITRGLKGGERVVVRGALRLAPGAKVAVMPAKRAP